MVIVTGSLGKFGEGVNNCEVIGGVCELEIIEPENMKPCGLNNFEKLRKKLDGKCENRREDIPQMTLNPPNYQLGSGIQRSHNRVCCSPT